MLHPKWSSESILRALTSADSTFAHLLPEPPSEEDGVGRPWYEYHATRGLGHRLTRIASAYHLAGRLGVGLRQEWGECPGANTGAVGVTDNVKIWDYLFGESEMLVERPSSTHPLRTESVSSVSSSPLGSIANEVPGYKPYSTNKLRHGDLAKHLFDSSVIFYQQLRARFVQRHSSQLASFLRDNQWTDCLVLGLHVRTGNGEGGEFDAKRRGIADLDAWAREATKTLAGFLTRYGHSKPPVLFVATDAVNVVGMLVKYMRAANSAVKVAALPQERELGTGVSYKVQDEHCLRAWSDQLMDNVLLSLADIVITARYSSFAQSMPMTLLFAEAQGRPRIDAIKKYPFCEFGLYGDVLQCYTTFVAWKKRNQEEINPGRVVISADWFSRKASLKPQYDSAQEDTLSYPLTTRDCLQHSAPFYFANERCFDAHLRCVEEPDCGDAS